MKNLYLLLLCFILFKTGNSQTVVVGGQCITGNITLTFGGTEAGKPYYEGVGTVLGQPNTIIQIYWIGAPDNVWVIAFDGQPYYENACNTMVVPGVSPNICPWTVVPGNSPACTGAAPLSVTGAVILPVTLSNFTATVQNNNKVLLQWTTQQETNNKGFTVQRSTDGQVWNDVSFVSGVGNSSSVSNYTFTDIAPANAVNYYRLRQEDFDGKTSYSPIVTAIIDNARFFTVANNPGNGIYQVNIIAAGNELTEMQVIDAGGKVILQKRTTLRNETIDLSRQAPGVYWLRVKKGNEQNGVKLIKL